MTEIRDIALDVIDEPETPLRAEIDDFALEELASSIRDEGLLYPIIVHANGDRFEVRDGHRRLLACRRLGLERVRCIVHDGDSPPPEAVKLKSNLLREDNTDAEIAVWLGELASRHNYSLEQLSNMVRRSEGWINDRVDLLRGDPDVLAALGARRINFSQAKVLNRCKDKGWRDLGLHYAQTDHVPAPRLHEWLVRNCPPVKAPVHAQPEPLPAYGTPEPIGPGIVCEYCGGHKDPQNMVQVWLHRWEWAMVVQILNTQQEQQEVGPA